jgi:hypothetical protein
MLFFGKERIRTLTLLTPIRIPRECAALWIELPTVSYESKLDTIVSSSTVLAVDRQVLVSEYMHLYCVLELTVY